MEIELKRRISELCAGDVRFDVPTREYTSMRVGGEADCLAYPPSVHHLAQLVEFLVQRRIPFYPVGNLTNIIVRDGGFRGVLLGLRRLSEVRLIDGGASCGFYAEAGASLAEVVNASVRQGMTGLEFLAGIPGSVGGAVKMNAGAWGREMKDVLGEVTIVEATGKVKDVPARELPFRYRALDLGESEIIAGASILLSRGEREEILAKIREVLEKRQARHPLDYPSSGSIFKNPAGKAAGKLIEEAGMKGRQIGGARVSEKHANFIVNTGQATASDVIRLINFVRRKVEEVHGITLETEVVIIGVSDGQEEAVEHI